MTTSLPPGRAALLAKSLREAIHIESAIISPRTSPLIESAKVVVEYLEGQADLPVGEVQWQPIETAPNGKSILVHQDDEPQPPDAVAAPNLSDNELASTPSGIK
jgi:hypothetical protein